MSDTAAKLVFVVYDVGVEPDVMRIVEEMSITAWTKWSDCTGKGETGIKEGTAIWPGFNTVLMAVINADLVDPLREKLHAMRDTFPIQPGLKIIVTDAIIM